MARKQEDKFASMHKPDEREVADDVRKAERELQTALWQFNEALGQDHVDYAIYSLEAAEKKLDMLLRRAKRILGSPRRDEESRVNIG